MADWINIEDLTNENWIWDNEYILRYNWIVDPGILIQFKGRLGGTAYPMNKQNIHAYFNNITSYPNPQINIEASKNFYQNLGFYDVNEQSLCVPIEGFGIEGFGIDNYPFLG